MRMMVKWKVNLRCQGGALNLISTNYPDHGHHGRLPLSREKNAHGRAGNRNRDLMVSSQELWPPSHEAGRFTFRYFLEKSFEKIQVSLKRDKKKGYFTWRHTYSYICDNIPPNSSLIKELFRKKNSDKIKIHILCSVPILQKSCRLWDNVRKIR